MLFLFFLQKINLSNVSNNEKTIYKYKVNQ